MSRPTPVSKDQFPIFRTLSTRWADNDVYGHMNNVVHYSLFDTAVNGWLLETGLLDFNSGSTVGLVVETGCQYFAEMAFPDAVTAGLGVERIGNSSVTYRIGLFRNDEEQTSAQGRFTHVYVDRLTRRPMALDAAWRERLESIAL